MQPPERNQGQSPDTRVAALFADAPEEAQPFIRRLTAELNRCPDPDLALTTFDRLTSSVINRQSFFKTLTDFPPIIARLVRLFISSSHLSEILVRDFHLSYLLITPERDARPLSPKTLADTIDRILNHATFSISGKLSAIRSLKERELLKIGIQDYILNVPLETTLVAISDLADAIVNAVSVLVYDVLTARYGTPNTSYGVVALGKLGGRELNYSSDIDLIFVYNQEGLLEKTTYHEFFALHAEGLIKHLTESTSGGMLYRTDARLRPDGNSGPLARASQAYHHYYESRGRLWERQMLIKARPIAGDLSFGRKFIDSLSPFVYPKTFFESPIDEIANMKWRIEEKKSAVKELNIKTCQGGIRDVEFIVQALQLMNGGENTSLRTTNTLDGIRVLLGAGLLKPNEAEQLSKGYIFYRKVEHLLQVQSFTQTHLVKDSDPETERLAFLLNLENRTVFRSVLNEHMTRIRILFETVFLSSSDPTVGSFNLLDESLGSGAEGVLLRSGIEHPETAHTILRQLAFGRFPRMNRRSDIKAFETLLPLLISDLKSVPNPDHTLANLERILCGYPFPETIFKYLAGHEDYRSALVTLSSFAHSLTHVLCEKPSYLDYLMTRIPEWKNGDTREPHVASHGSLFVYKQVQTLKLVLQLEWGILDLPTFHQRITELAENIVLERFQSVFSTTDEIVFLALGKFGGRELGLKSDLDIVFVCSDHADVNGLMEKCRVFLQSTSANTSEGKLYEVDVRLRPDGKKSPLVVSESTYRSYFENRAMFWERQALTKARTLCGPDDLRQRLDRMVKSILYDQPLQEVWRQQIADMRQRQISEKISTADDSRLEIKYARGGLTDIEYAIQALQMKAGTKTSDLRDTVPLAEAMKRLKTQELPKAEMFEDILEAYSFLRRVEHYHFVALDRKSNKLPNDEKQLALLAKFCKLYTKEAFLEFLSVQKNKAEIFFKSVIEND